MDEFEAHRPYLAAVAAELERVGFQVEEWFADPNEPRDGCISRAFEFNDCDQVLVGWQEERGWCVVPAREVDHYVGRFVFDVAVPRVAVPSKVAAAVAVMVDHEIPAAAGGVSPWDPQGLVDEDPVFDEEDSGPLDAALAVYQREPARGAS